MIIVIDFGVTIAVLLALIIFEIIKHLWKCLWYWIRHKEYELGHDYYD